MNARDVITEAMKRKGITQAQLAGLVGMRSQSNVSEAFKRDMKISLVAKFVDALGYELVLVEKKPGPKEEGRLKIDP